MKKNPRLHKRQFKRGLTLIELLVVLFILAAVAGVTLAIFPNFQKRTHGSTSAASIRAAATGVVANLVTRGEIGDNFDGLVNDPAGTGTVPDYIATSDGLTVFPLTLAELDALNDIGITSVFPAAFASFADLETDPVAESATFDGHDYAAPITLAVDTDVAVLAAAAVTQVVADFNLGTAPDQIFAFGIGEGSTLVGSNNPFLETPLHTPGEGSQTTTYSRYALLIGYDATDEEAFYVGVTCIDDGENFNNINANVGEFLEAAE